MSDTTPTPPEEQKKPADVSPTSDASPTPEASPTSDASPAPDSSPTPDASQKASDAHEVTLLGGSRFGRWLDNYWYHYKVPTLIGLFLVVTVIFCIVQCASKPKDPDFTICYAGSADLRPTASNTIAADMEAALSDDVCEIIGEKDATISIVNYLIRIGATDASVKSLTATNLENLVNELNVANSYLFLLDEELYNRYTVTSSGANYMAEVAPYLGDNSTVELTSDGRGVYLRSTYLATLPGFAELPDDTVLCLRVKFSVSGSLNSSKQDKLYARQESLFRRMLETP
jgi:hypothetical protein